MLFKLKRMGSSSCPVFNSKLVCSADIYFVGMETITKKALSRLVTKPQLWHFLNNLIVSF